PTVLSNALSCAVQAAYCNRGASQSRGGNAGPRGTSKAGPVKGVGGGGAGAARWLGTRAATPSLDLHRGPIRVPGAWVGLFCGRPAAGYSKGWCTKLVGL